MHSSGADVTAVMSKLHPEPEALALGSVRIAEKYLVPVKLSA